MVETGLKHWLGSDEEPGDFYQLVGLPRLCPDHARLLNSFEEANEYLFHFQNHKDKTTRDRARVLHLQIADARRIVSDRDRWKKYDQALVDKLRALCGKNPEFTGPNPKLDDLRRWLALVHQVDPERVEELVAILTARPEPPAETQCLSHEAIKTELLPTAGKQTGVRELSKAASGRSSESSPEMHFTSAPEPVPPAVLVPKKDLPPPPPRGQGTRLPPPLPKEVPPQTGPRTPVAQPIPAGPISRDSTGSPLLLVVMAAFLTALILGTLGLTIAWASGAFGEKHSQVQTRPAEVADSAFGIVEIPNEIIFNPNG